MDAIRFFNLLAKVSLPVLLFLVLGGPKAGFVAFGLIAAGMVFARMCTEARAA